MTVLNKDELDRLLTVADQVVTAFDTMQKRQGGIKSVLDSIGDLEDALNATSIRRARQALKAEGSSSFPTVPGSDGDC